MDAAVASIIVAGITVLGTIITNVITNRINANKKQEMLIAKVNETLTTKLAINDEKLNRLADSTNKQIEALEQRLLKSREEEISELKESDTLAKEGIQAILRDRLLQLYRFCTETRCEQDISKAYSTDDEKKNFENMYQKYHSLGANGVMTVKFDHFMELPDYEPKNNTKPKISKVKTTTNK